MTHQYFGILVAHLYQNRFKVQEHELQKALVTRDHGASGKETKKNKQKKNSSHFIVTSEALENLIIKTLF